MSKKSRKKASMSGKDSHGMTWLSGWGKDRKKTKRLERRLRERRALRQEFAEGGIVRNLPSDDHEPIILSEGSYWTPEQVRALYGKKTLDKINERKPK